MYYWASNLCWEFGIMKDLSPADNLHRAHRIIFNTAGPTCTYNIWPNKPAVQVKLGNLSPSYCMENYFKQILRKIILVTSCYFLSSQYKNTIRSNDYKLTTKFGI